MLSILILCPYPFLSPPHGCSRGGGGSSSSVVVVVAVVVAVVVVVVVVSIIWFGAISARFNNGVEGRGNDWPLFIQMIGYWAFTAASKTRQLFPRLQSAVCEQ